MDLAALLTSAGINIAVCVVLFSLFSILRKQPVFVNVYAGRRVAAGRAEHSGPICLERFMPTPDWLLRAWDTPEEEVMAVGGLDAVVFMRIVVFCIRVFFISSTICLFLVLPVNYYGQDQMPRKSFHSLSLEVFSIANLRVGSKWLWVHCLALYVITSSACVLLYLEYRSITIMRLQNIAGSSSCPSFFTVLVRGIPWSPDQSYSDTVKKYFTHYYASSYLQHQMVYLEGAVDRLLNDAMEMSQMLKSVTFEPQCKARIMPCFACGGTSNSFKMLSKQQEPISHRVIFGDLDLARKDKECAAAFVFLRSRFAATMAARNPLSSDPMLWVTEMAPAPLDIYWANLCIPYKQLWLRKVATFLASGFIMVLFIFPVTFVQGLTQLNKLSSAFPSLRKLLEKKLINRLVTGYLPSVILIIFLYLIPPTMMLFSALEGPASRGGRKISACIKILFFTILNVFFVNVFSGSVIHQWHALTSPRDLPEELAQAVPVQATFFMTYIFSSGWAGLACELMQLFPLIWNLIEKYVLKKNKDNLTSGTYSFPFYTEVPRVLLFSLLGFTCSIMTPLILPFLLVYFFLAYVIYKNQILNVYIPKYESWGQYWPIAHNTTIFSLVLSQIIALGVFGIKESTVATGFTIPLIILTLLFNEYCRQRFLPLFHRTPAELLIEMDLQDRQHDRFTRIYEQFRSSYDQLPVTARDFCESRHGGISDRESLQRGKELFEESKSWAVHNDMKTEEPRKSMSRSRRGST